MGESHAIGGDRAGENGAIERFIEAFNAFESDKGLFVRCEDESGFAWWDLVRYTVQYALCAERGIYVAQQATAKPLPARGARFVVQAWRLAKDVSRVARLHGTGLDGIYMFRRRPEDILVALANAGRPCLVVSDGSAFGSRHIGLDRKSIDLFVRVASRFVRCKPAMERQVRELDREIRERFGSEVDVARIIRGKYAKHRAALVAWRWILARAGKVGVVGFVGDDSQKTLVHLANRGGIVTREFQHGYMGTSHLNYSYPPLATPPATLPVEVVVHRDTGDISYPVALVLSTARGGVEGSDTPRDIDVLIGASPTRMADSLAIAGAVVGKGLAVAVKLHPNQTIASSGFRDRFTEEELEVYPGDADFATLARRSRIYVPANPTSTTVFEAVEGGAHLFVVDYGGMKLTAMVDPIVSRRVASFDQLYEAIGLYLGCEGALRHGP